MHQTFKLIHAAGTPEVLITPNRLVRAAETRYDARADIARSLLDLALSQAMAQPRHARMSIRRAAVYAVRAPDLAYRIREVGGILGAW